MATAAEPAPWEQQDDETDRQFLAFTCFRDQGPSRTLAETCRRLYGANKRRVKAGEEPATRDEAIGCVRQWNRSHNWQSRVRAYDEHLRVIRDRAIEKETESQGERLVRLRERSNEETLAFASSLKLRAARMLEAPIETITRESTIVSEDGHTTIIHQTVEPARWSQKDIALFVRISRELEEAVLFPERRGHSQARVPLDGPVSDEERAGSRNPTPSELACDDAVLAAWRAEKRREMLAFPAMPSGWTPEIGEQQGISPWIESDVISPTRQPDPPRFEPVEAPPSPPPVNGRQPPRHRGSEF